MDIYRTEVAKMVLGNNGSGDFTATSVESPTSMSNLRGYAGNVWSHMGGWVGVGAAVVSAAITGYAIKRLG